MTAIVKGFSDACQAQARGDARRQASEKPRGRKPRGEFAPAVVSVYGDLAPVHALIFRFQTGMTGEYSPRRWVWPPCAGSEGWSCRERSAFSRSKAALRVAVGGGEPLPNSDRPRTWAAMLCA